MALLSSHESASSVLQLLGVALAQDGPLSGVEPQVGVEVRRLVEALAADVAAKGLLARVDAVVPLEHAERGEALAAHGAAVRLLLGVPAHVHLQLTGEAEALAALTAAVPPLQALAGVGRAGRQRGQQFGRPRPRCVLQPPRASVRRLFFSLFAGLYSGSTLVALSLACPTLVFVFLCLDLLGREQIWRNKMLCVTRVVVV